jgi:hypothetical protein
MNIVTIVEYVIMLVLLAGAFWWLYLETLKSKNEDDVESIAKLAKMTKFNTVFVVFASVCLCFNSMLLSHGANVYTSDIIQRFQNTPVEQSNEAWVLDEKSGSLSEVAFFFYRWDCDDCYNSFSQNKALASVLESSGVDVYWVSTESYNGKSLANKLKVTSVPCVTAWNASGEHENFYAYTSDDGYDISVNASIEEFLRTGSASVW